MHTPKYSLWVGEKYLKKKQQPKNKKPKADVLAGFSRLLAGLPEPRRSWGTAAEAASANRWFLASSFSDAKNITVS